MVCAVQCESTQDEDEGINVQYIAMGALANGFAWVG